MPADDITVKKIPVMGVVAIGARAPAIGPEHAVPVVNRARVQFDELDIPALVTVTGPSWSSSRTTTAMKPRSTWRCPWPSRQPSSPSRQPHREERAMYPAWTETLARQHVVQLRSAAASAKTAAAAATADSAAKDASARPPTARQRAGWALIQAGLWLSGLTQK
jgi:hypothetical protein